MKRTYRVAIVGQDQEECELFQATLSADSYRVDVIHAPDVGAFTYDSRDYDLCLLCLPKGYPSGEGTFTASVSMGGANFIYVMTAPSEAQQHWAYRQGAIDVAIRPQSPNELRFRVERALLSQGSQVETVTSDEVLLTLLESLDEAGVETIEPVVDATMPYGYAYPDVEYSLGRTPVELESLEHLASEGFLTRTLANRVRICPTCSDFRMNFREVCPKCQSINVYPKEILHHYKCAHVGTLDTFRQGADLVCPKCNTELRQIGLDYDKPAGHWNCGDCHAIFPEPEVEAQCMRCSRTCQPDETLTHPIYRYEVTPLVAEAVAEGRMDGVNIASILKNEHTGLYSRQYFEHELMRELARFNRYGTPYALLAVQIIGLDDVRRTHPGQVDEYTSAIYAALSHGLRTLDTTCVLERDVLAVLLPGTPDTGAEVVMARMREDVHQLDYLRSIREPKISVGIVSNNTKFQSYQEAIDAALQKIQ
ncbi:MAG: hypothetical protein AMXMBFR84_50920 [Candidatus Hydrogenedentota bacterium]